VLPTQHLAVISQPYLQIKKVVPQHSHSCNLILVPLTHHSARSVFGRLTQISRYGAK